MLIKKIQKLVIVTLFLLIMPSCAAKNENSIPLNESGSSSQDSIEFFDDKLNRTYTIEKQDEYDKIDIYDSNHEKVEGLYLASLTKVNKDCYVCVEGVYTDNNVFKRELVILFDNKVDRFSLTQKDIPLGFSVNQYEVYKTSMNDNVLELYSPSSYVKGYFDIKNNTYSMEYLISEEVLTENDYSNGAKIRKIDENANFIQLMGEGGGDGATYDVYVKTVNNTYYLGKMPIGPNNNGYGVFKNNDIYMMTSSSFDVFKDYKLFYCVQDYIKLGNIGDNHYNELVAVQRINDEKYLLMYIPNFCFEETVAQNIAKATYHLVLLDKNRITKDINTNINVDFSMWGPYSVFMSTSKDNSIVTIEVKNNDTLRYSFKIDVNNEEIYDYVIYENTVHMK